MKKIYIVPQMCIIKHVCTTALLDASDPNKGGNYNVGGGGGSDESGGTGSGSGSGLTQHSKIYNAWSSWDE